MAASSLKRIEPADVPQMQGPIDLMHLKKQTLGDPGLELEVLRLFDQMAARADELARYEARSATVTEKEFDDSREESRRGLIAVALGAALVIILLLVTASDIARMALETHRARR